MLVRRLLTFLNRSLIAASLGVATCVLAQSSGGDFELIQTTIDGGGGASSGAGFALVGSLAQPEADTRHTAGGEYQLAGGFWANAGANDGIFADGFENN